MRCSDINLEWRIADVERKAQEGSRIAGEFHSLVSSVDSLERTLREVSSLVDELRYELQESQETVSQLTHRIENLENGS